MGSHSVELYAFMWMTYSVLVTKFYHHVVSAIHKDYQIGSEDTNDVLFVGQGVRWKTEDNSSCIQVDQERGIQELGEIEFDNKLRDTDFCQPALHTQ